MGAGTNLFPLYSESVVTGAAPRISSLLIKPASAVCNLACAYCFYLDRDADPYQALPGRRMTLDTLERLVDSYLFYSYPQSVFAFQGGEPTLAGLPFFEKLVEFEKQYGRNGQSVSNAIQTNGILLDKHWCDLFREYQWLVGLSLDGPEEMNDRYRVHKEGRGTWKRVIQSVELLQQQRVEFNILCVLSQANVGRPKELYRFFRGLGIDHMQFIPLAEFDAAGAPLPYTITAEQYGRFLVEVFDAWWPDRRNVRIRFFDNLAEALAGQKPGTCTMHETCDSYVVVEYNGDVYPCDFFVETAWKLGNITLDSWAEIARRTRRYSFASKKTLAHPECQVCEYQNICHGGCPKFRHGPHGKFEELDYFCAAYKMIYARGVEPLRKELRRIMPAPPETARIPRSPGMRPLA
ncbi:MAG TPA: anaerobic sulfatase maturase [Bryobacteraceae bacterium]|nr:anaerobic sulfatase maturase [Bryobacteraceae bacterium]